MKKVLDSFFQYLPLNQEDRSRGCHVSAIGYTKIPPHTPYPPGQHPKDRHFVWDQGRVISAYQMIYITEGKGTFESRDTGMQSISAGQLFILFPGTWHRYAPDLETGWTEYWVEFDGETAHRWIKECKFTPQNAVVTPGLDEQLLALFIRVVQQLKNDTVDHQQVMGSLCLLLLAETEAAVRRKNSTGKDIEKLIKKSRCLMLERLPKSINLQSLARELKVGYSWFRRKFRESTGFSPAQYYLELRLNRARELLKNSTRPIATIAEESGFTSAYYFARIFKQKTGKTSQAFRKEYRGGARSLLQRIHNPCEGGRKY